MTGNGDDGALLMASDGPSGDGSGVKGASINHTLTDEADARRIFDAATRAVQAPALLHQVDL